MQITIKCFIKYDTVERIGFPPNQIFFLIASNWKEFTALHTSTHNFNEIVVRSRGKLAPICDHNELTWLPYIGLQTEPYPT